MFRNYFLPGCTPTEVNSTFFEPKKMSFTSTRNVPTLATRDWFGVSILRTTEVRLLFEEFLSAPRELIQKIEITAVIQKEIRKEYRLRI